MIEHLRFDEWEYTLRMPRSIELRVVDGKIQTNNPAWKNVDKDGYEKGWEDFRGDSTKWLEEFDGLSIGQWKARYIERGIIDGSAWELTYRSDGREYEKSGSNAWPGNWDAFHNLIEQLGFDNRTDM